MNNLTKLALVLTVLSVTSCYYRTKNGIPPVDAEIAAMSAALESYRYEHGTYPTDASATEILKPNTTFDPSAYVSASQFLYRQLSGDSDGDRATTSPTDGRRYFHFPSNMLGGTGKDTYVIDPWGNSYGYSTFKAKNPDSNEGNNETFDLWSTGGGTRPMDRKKWHTNW